MGWAYAGQRRSGTQPSERGPSGSKASKRAKEGHAPHSTTKSSSLTDTAERGGARCNREHAARITRQAAHNQTCKLQRATCDPQHGSDRLQRATYRAHRAPTTCKARHAKYTVPSDRKTAQTRSCRRPFPLHCTCVVDRSMPAVHLSPHRAVPRGLPPRNIRHAAWDRAAVPLTHHARCGAARRCVAHRNGPSGEAWRMLCTAWCMVRLLWYSGYSGRFSVRFLDDDVV